MTEKAKNQALKSQDQSAYQSSEESTKSTDQSAYQSSENTPVTAVPSEKPHKPLDWRWLLLSLAATAVLIAALVVNAVHTDDSAEKVASTIKADNGDTKINWDRYPTTDVELSSTLTITESGTYHLTGELADGLIIVKADSDSGKVRLILDNVTIKNSQGPAIACYSADDLVIELVGENTLEDGTSYSSDFDEDVRGAIYSKDDLSFTGDGTLNLTAHLEDGIVGKDDLKFNSGTYNITSTDDGIRGKDSVYIVAGTYNINAGGDAIKSTNETDDGKGFILIENGDFTIKSVAKGIKAVNSILIYDGTYKITSTDDSIHSNNYVGIIGGTYEISSSDDGIHADNELIVDGGTVKIVKSYEGLEAQKITINGGDISVTASDDGINAGGGADSSSQNRPGANGFNSSTACVLTFNGGTTYVNAAGDGVDSNGYIYINGGTVTVDGPTNNGDGALDAEYGIVQTGGTVIAVGASGMAEAPSNSSSVNNVSIYFSSTLAAGTEVVIKDSSGATVISHTSAKTFAHMAAGSAELKTSETYTIYVNGTEYSTFTISSTTTTVGNSMMNFQNGAGGAGGPGGQGSQGGDPNAGTNNAGGPGGNAGAAGRTQRR